MLQGYINKSIPTFISRVVKRFNVYRIVNERSPVAWNVYRHACGWFHMAKFTPNELNILRIAPDIVTGFEHHSHMLVFNRELDHSALEKIVGKPLTFAMVSASWL